MQKIASTICAFALALSSAAALASGPASDSGYSSTTNTGTTVSTDSSMTDTTTDRTGSVGNDQETNAGTNTRDASTDPASVNPNNSTDAR